MKKARIILFPLLFLMLLSLFPPPSWPQMILGQYEDEAPLRTWNTIGLMTAPSLALGGSQFALARDCSVSLSNPALLTSLPRITLTLNTSYSSAQLFKYSIINTGIVIIDENLSLGHYALDFGGISIRLGNWAFAVSQTLIEIYDRPSVKLQFTDMNYVYYSLEFSQEGLLKNTNFSIARKFFNRLSVGLGINFVQGDYKKDLREEFLDTAIMISDSKSMDFKGFYINGGLFLELSRKLAFAVTVRTPFQKKADSQSLYHYNSPVGNTDIRNEASAQSIYKQPLVLGMGISYKFLPKLRFASDVALFNWSKYKVDFFGEDRERNFKNIIKIGAGIEYTATFNIFGQKIDIPLRTGINYDPQPMEVPSSSYFLLSFGTGIHWGKFHIDASGQIGKERGSGNSLSAKRFALSLSVHL